MSDLPSDYRDRIDLRQIIAEIDGKRAETQKLQEDTEKFVAEQHKLMAERAKYNREIWIVPVTVFGAILAAAIARLPEIMHALR